MGWPGYVIVKGTGHIHIYIYIKGIYKGYKRKIKGMYVRADLGQRREGAAAALMAPLAPKWGVWQCGDQ